MGEVAGVQLRVSLFWEMMTRREGLNDLDANFFSLNNITLSRLLILL